jgi:hypothetical protein
MGQIKHTDGSSRANEPLLAGREGIEDGNFIAFCAFREEMRRNSTVTRRRTSFSRITKKKCLRLGNDALGDRADKLKCQQFSALSERQP